MKKPMVFTVVLSMLFLCVPAPTDAGAVAGLATEWTQILNHVQLVMGYIRQGLQLENELKQYEEELKQELVLPQQVFWSYPAGFIAARASRARRASPGVFDGQSRCAVSQYVQGLQFPHAGVFQRLQEMVRRPRSIRR